MYKIASWIILIGLVYLCVWQATLLQQLAVIPWANGLNLLTGVIGLLLSIVIIFITSNIKKARRDYAMILSFRQGRTDAIDRLNNLLFSIDKVDVVFAELRTSAKSELLGILRFSKHLQWSDWFRLRWEVTFFKSKSKNKETLKDIVLYTRIAYENDIHE